MSLHEYLISQKIAAEDYPFYALIMAAMRQADSLNIERLKAQWPEEYMELKARYEAPGGALNDVDFKFLDSMRRNDEANG